MQRSLPLDIALIVLITVFTGLSFAFQSNGEPIRKFHTNEKVVALTFDDGPQPTYTPKILDVLNKHHIKATFFVLGDNARIHPKLIKQIMTDGHDLGSHTMHHHVLKKKSVEEIISDLQSVDNILRNYGYTKEITFRSPYGITSENLKIALQKLNKRHVLFNFSPEDWKKISAKQIYDNVMKHLKPGLIILLHDGGKRRDNTIKATEMLIKSLKQKGYRFMTVTELLSLQP